MNTTNQWWVLDSATKKNRKKMKSDLKMEMLYRYSRLPVKTLKQC